jgi:glycine hydroxymethyltransferase
LILARESHAEKLNKEIFPGIQGGPLMHVIAAKAVAFKEALSGEFRTYQRQVVTNAKRLAAELSELGYRLVSGGTDNHLMLIDLRRNGLSGAQAELILDRAWITVNKNSIPFDPEKPAVTSGIRVGTPAVTTRGMKEEEMAVIARLIHQALSAREDADSLEGVRRQVTDFCSQFPLHKSIYDREPS